MPRGACYPVRRRVLVRHRAAKMVNVAIDFCSRIVHGVGMPNDVNIIPLMPGQLLARGVSRHLRSHDFVSVEVIECKSSRADFQSDSKWQGYLEWCDRFFWAVDTDFPTELLPEDTGLIIADGYDAEIIRMGPETKLAAARRKVIIQKFARHAALRAQTARDPGMPHQF